MKILRWVGVSTFRLIIFVLTAAAFVALWEAHPEWIVAGFDWNLAMLKKICGLLPEPWNFRAEATLRTVLYAERVMLFGEVSFVIGAVIRLFRRMFFPVGQE